MLLVFVCQNDILGHFHLFELVHVELVLFGEEAELFLVPDVQFVDVDVFQTIEQRLELLVILQFNFPLDFLSLFGVISWLAALRVSTVFVAGAIPADESAQRCGGTSCGSIPHTIGPDSNDCKIQPFKSCFESKDLRNHYWFRRAWRSRLIEWLLHTRRN